MPGSRSIWAVLVGLLVLPTLVCAQERRELSLQAGDAPVSVIADRIESLERERLLIAEGRVEIEQGVVRLEADRVEVNTETGEAVAVGRILFFDGRDRLLGERLEYNFRTGTGIVYRGEGLAQPHFFFGGDRLERLGEKSYRMTGGVFTTCEAETPAWSVRWGQATAHLDDYVWGTNASFWVWKIPLIPFIPVFGASLRQDRHTGLLTPRFSSSNTKGFTFQQPFFWAIADNQDLTLAPTYYDKRGFGLGAHYRYVRREGSRGEMEGFGLYDTEKKEWRGVVGLRHDEEITPRLSLKADVGYVSDDQFFSEFGDGLDERSRQRLDSNVSLTQRWDSWNLVARLFTYEDLTTPESVELSRLPEIRLNAFQQPVPQIPGLLWQFEGSYVNFVRDVGADGQRLDLHPQLSYPLSPGGYFTVTPRLGLRETLYDTQVVGTIRDRGFLVEDTEKTLGSRTLFEASVDLEARAYRVFDLGGVLGIQKVQHSIEPRISYNFVSDPDSDDLPQYDGIDSIGSTNNITYSLTNRLKARAVGEEGTAGRVWELMRLTLSQSYNFDDFGASTGPTPNRLSDLVADLIFEPMFGLRFRGTSTFDPDELRVKTATTDTIYETQDWRVTLGTRHGDGARLQFVQATAQARFGQRWGARFSTNYDVETKTVVENRFEINFREQCWAVTVALIDRTNEDAFHVTVNLLELGHYGFGQVFGAQ